MRDRASAHSPPPRIPLVLAITFDGKFYLFYVPEVRRFLETYSYLFNFSAKFHLKKKGEAMRSPYQNNRPNFYRWLLTLDLRRLFMEERTGKNDRKKLWASSFFKRKRINIRHLSHSTRFSHHLPPSSIVFLQTFCCSDSPYSTENTHPYMHTAHSGSLYDFRHDGWNMDRREKKEHIHNLKTFHLVKVYHCGRPLETDLHRNWIL